MLGVVVFVLLLLLTGTGGARGWGEPPWEPPRERGGSQRREGHPRAAGEGSVDPRVWGGPTTPTPPRDPGVWGVPAQPPKAPTPTDPGIQVHPPPQKKGTRESRVLHPTPPSPSARPRFWGVLPLPPTLKGPRRLAVSPSSPKKGNPSIWMPPTPKKGPRNPGLVPGEIEGGSGGRGLRRLLLPVAVAVLRVLLGGEQTHKGGTQ